ncbi:Mitogen-activated protein kinase kinase kinase YODA [Dendrobium catenatum]|uniref:mitogen-activated protein kinase kinase kinase n=1 Tax=Dendrobium catenatum TaxID=906689 RepID=A0A2I0WVM2_9ASPA|nr:Mitogen-activated protein kinase kinase kinase YODA [Dendrobium catenatum]
MPWWKPSSFSSSPSSPSPKRSSSADSSPLKATRRELGLLWSKRGDSPSRLQTRQYKLRTFDAASSTSPNSLESLTYRSSSSPVLHPHPHPLPLPECSLSNGGGGVTAAASCNGGCESCRRPSLMGAAADSGVEVEEGCGGVVDCTPVVGTDMNGERVPAASGRSAFPNVQRSPEHFDNPTKRYNFSNHRKAIHDPNSVESITFRLSIPAKSAPPSGFSSPVHSPRRLSNVDVFPSVFSPSEGLHFFSAPEVSSMDMMVGMSPQTSSEKLHGSPDISPSYSPTIRSPILKSKNPSAPQSPLHPKIYSENSSTWHDNNMNLNVHPLPLPPGPAVLPQPNFSHQNANKNESASMTSQWQKQKLIGSGTFGNVYRATNRHTGALCAMKEVNIIPDDPKSAECLKQLEQVSHLCCIQEIKVLSKLKHPNIVQYYGSEFTEDRFFIYLEYVYPGSIDKYVQEHCGAMTESVVRNFTRHILKGLAYLHSTNNIHRAGVSERRALFPASGARIESSPSGQERTSTAPGSSERWIKVLAVRRPFLRSDMLGRSALSGSLNFFGLPLRSEVPIGASTRARLSRAAPALSLKGSPYWMAPEVVQATMSKDVGYDFSVDIWSLGCTIIEMFTGKHPWSGLEGAAAMFKVLHKDPPMPETLSSEGKDFLQRCFRRNPAERPTANMLLDHPFIRNSNHYHLHGSIQAFAGIKLNETTNSPRDRPRARSEPFLKGRQPTNGEISHSQAEISESTAPRLTLRSAPEVLHSLFPHSGSSMNTSNGFHAVVGNLHASSSVAFLSNNTYSFTGNQNHHHKYAKAQGGHSLKVMAKRGRAKAVRVEERSIQGVAKYRGS